MNKTSRILALAAFAAAALTACGGGGGSDAPATPSSVTIAGTAAKGAALAGAAVSIKCAAGTGSATTGSDGAYTVTIADANLPCALKVVGTEGSVFHSVVAGTGSSGTFAANITPLTEMLVAQLAGAAPATYFSGFGSTTTVSAATLTAAIAYVRAAVSGTTDLTGVNPVTDTLVVGNPLDLKIDAVMAAFVAAGVTLQDIAATIAANPAAPTVVSAPLAPQATDCAWLKSGKYRIINPTETDPRWKAHVVTINAQALTLLDQDEVTAPLTSDGGCQYTLTESDGYTNRLMVSSSGVMLVYSQSSTGSDRAIAVGLPEQTLPIAELAGVWNAASFDPASGITAPGYVALSQEITVNATGEVTANLDCVGLTACVAQTGPFARFAANAPSGGFDILETNVVTGRLFSFKTAAGKAVFMAINDDLQLTIATRKEAIGELPAVGTVSDFREFQISGNGSIGNVLDQTNTVTATDAAAKTVTRLRASDSRLDTITFDSPRDGLRYRAANACTIGGNPATCAQTVQLPLQGIGINLSLSVGNTTPASAFYNFAITKPAVLN